MLQASECFLMDGPCPNPLQWGYPNSQMGLVHVKPIPDVFTHQSNLKTTSFWLGVLIDPSNFPVEFGLKIAMQLMTIYVNYNTPCNLNPIPPSPLPPPKRRSCFNIILYRELSCNYSKQVDNISSKNKTKRVDKKMKHSPIWNFFLDMISWTR